MKKVALLGIDLQVDFVDDNGTLKVNNAEKDAERIANFITNNVHKIHHLSFTLDSHHPIHIASQCFWKDKNGKNPDLFTVITSDDAKNGNWTPQYNPQWAYKYLEELEKGGTKCTIWPHHCILGTKGWSLTEKVINAACNWEIENGKPYNLWFKGTNWYTEHYSIFKANVPYPNAPETGFNQELIKILNGFDELYICGEAMDFCCLNSVRDMNSYVPDFMKKVIILEDCMSPIDSSFSVHTNPVYQESVKLGAKIMKSTDVSL